MWFCQKLLKKAKTNSQIVKIWLFLWKSTSGSTNIADFWFVAFVSNFWPKIAQKRQNVVDFTKIPKTTLFYCNFWRFWAIFGKTTSLVARQNRTIWTFGKKLLKNAKNWKSAILVLPDVDFHKNSQIFTMYLIVTFGIFGKTTSGSLPKQDNFILWLVHVW